MRTNYEHVYSNVSEPATTPRACEDAIPNCKDYPPSTCTNPDYDLWVEDNCRKHCGRCMYRIDTPTF